MNAIFVDAWAVFGAVLVALGCPVLAAGAYGAVRMHKQFRNEGQASITWENESIRIDGAPSNREYVETSISAPSRDSSTLTAPDTRRS